MIWLTPPTAKFTINKQQTHSLISTNLTPKTNTQVTTLTIRYPRNCIKVSRWMLHSSLKYNWAEHLNTLKTHYNLSPIFLCLVFTDQSLSNSFVLKPFLIHAFFFYFLGLFFLLFWVGHTQFKPNKFSHVDGKHKIIQYIALTKDIGRCFSVIN